ncbi:hydroxyacylglutathione hydrolase [Prochlorococcus marinus]|uniref:Hydroxyacylglutathione hydrolase n=1 Tax=Prochlorococcus marinus (strain MIT 9211) TaxID=93059 RepID=GLO2_PROM4|nr:hydroxyacylglutathione hydrolase [Prochlorococcus marinus]A9BEI3.1 RecName: Full=Hydroxyacylglutathione hydrolase; AltName: Full=Glyoxalase II; Short=Glx II [Prochlorococcus marinus str. MIT 9211]ABX08493.1 Putative hydroxyacylglutathione hydrolase [Prochlorococcus marinus str. MIT 9211]
MTQEKKDFTIHALPVLKDNIIWIWEASGQAVVVDPAVSEPVKEFLSQNNLALNSVLQTHHHDDHIGGTRDLISNWPSASIIACKTDLERIPFQTHSVTDQEVFTLFGYSVKVLEVPGHTRGHVAYYLSDTNADNRNPALFCGDTLFAGGCGRLFEGTPHEMFKSLKLLNSLPSNTKIYCAHEYTESNLHWANHLYPEDLLIKKRLEYVSSQRANGLLSLPSTIAEERKTNLFFRARTLEQFSQFRKHKDNWMS